MKLGIMQPYFMPYIGYWQLMNYVDKYVIYDDVNFIKGGWINRNRILLNGNPSFFNIPMLGASSNKLINQIDVNLDKRVLGKKLRTLESAYEKAPQFPNVYPLLEKILGSEIENLAEYISNSIYLVSEYLGISTKFIVSSNLEKNCSLRGQEKVISICEILGADEYCNAIGGRELYSKQEFQRHNITLKFLESDRISYKQFDNEFQANLSLIDVMMFNSQKEIQQMLMKYRLI